MVFEQPRVGQLPQLSAWTSHHLSDFSLFWRSKWETTTLKHWGSSLFNQQIHLLRDSPFIFWDLKHVKCPKFTQVCESVIRQHPNSKNTYNTHHYWSLSLYLPSFTHGIFLGKHQTIKKRHLSDIQPLTIHRDAMLNHDPWPWTWKFIFICWKPPTTQFHCVKVRAIPCCIRVIFRDVPPNTQPPKKTPHGCCQAGKHANIANENWSKRCVSSGPKGLKLQNREHFTVKTSTKSSHANMVQDLNNRKINPSTWWQTSTNKCHVGIFV